MMLIGVGDGGNNPPHPDPYDQAQNPALIPGKVLRIDPLPQADGAPYGIPPDNPFVGVAGVHPEIFALGLRHPQNFAYDIVAGGPLILSDIGQHQIEEINLLYPGHNYGWPVREGTFVTDRLRQDDLYALPADDATPRLHLPGGTVRSWRGHRDHRWLRLSRQRGAGTAGPLPVRGHVVNAAPFLASALTY